MKKSSFLYILIFISTLACSSDYETSFNYFGNVMASKLNKNGFTSNNYNYDNVDNDTSFSPYSKLGGQISIYNDKYKFTSQAITYRNHHEYKAKFTWLNVNYDFNENLALRVGRMQSNLLFNSDSLHIDYIHTMTHSPNEVYRIIALEHYDGVELTYKDFINDDYNYAVTLVPYGKAKQNINTTFDIEENIELKNINSIRLNITNDDNIEIHTSYTKLKSSLEDSSALKTVTNGLKSYGNNVDEYSYEDKDTTIFTLGLNYSYENYILNTEISRYETKSMNPDTTAYYVMLGYNWDKFTPYIAYAKSKNDKEHFDTTGLNTPDATSASLKRGLDDILYLTNYSQRTQSLGLRYNIKPGIAIKTQIDRITTTNHGSISDSTVSSSGYERRGILGRFAGTDNEAVYLYTIGLSFAF